MYSAFSDRPLTRQRRPLSIDWPTDKDGGIDSTPLLIHRNTSALLIYSQIPQSLFTRLMKQKTVCLCHIMWNSILLLPPTNLPIKHHITVILYTRSGPAIRTGRPDAKKCLTAGSGVHIRRLWTRTQTSNFPLCKAPTQETKDAGRWRPPHETIPALITHVQIKFTSPAPSDMPTHNSCCCLQLRRRETISELIECVGDRTFLVTWLANIRQSWLMSSGSRLRAETR